MLFLDFVKWWYGAGWALRVQMLVQHVSNMSHFFSIGTLLKTLFSPWRQNVSQALNDQTLGDHISAHVDNAVSRLVGFTVRIIMLFVAVISLVMIILLNAFYVLVWPLIPFSPAIIIATGTLL